MAALTRVAVYHRHLAAGEARVWENVRDWEHLPWLHRTSFRSVALEDEGGWGWRARVGLHPAPQEIRLELAIERPPEGGTPRRYVARTLEGPGAGTEIWTRVTPRAAEETDVEVEFLVPRVDPTHANALGAAYVALYTRLWDEDEAMMVRRADQLARRAPPKPSSGGAIDLGPLDALRPRLPFCVDWAGARWRVIELDGALLAHATVCPHLLGPLDEAPLEDGCLVCPWHGYRFDLRSGRCAHGRLRLPTPPCLEVGADGCVRLGDPA